MKKDNKRMRKNTYIERFFAVFLSVAMLISMTPEVFAAPGSAISEPSVETITDNTENDSQSVVANESTGTGETEGPSEQTEETKSTGTEESDSIIDGSSVVSGEETMETIAADNESSETSSEDLVEEKSEREPMLTVFAEGDATVEPSLNLEQAKDYTVTKETQQVKVLSLSENENKLTVDSAAGLILLSNILPNQYENLSIELKTTNVGWDVIGQQVYTYTETVAEGGETTQKTITCSFLGLGNEVNPYKGTMTIAGGSEGYSITANRALFNAISTDAILPSNINFLMAGNNSRQIVLADQVIKGSKTGKQVLECAVTLTTGTGADAATSDTIGGILGTLKTDTSASVTLTNNLTGTLTVSDGDNRGLFCNTMASGSSLTASLTNKSADAKIEVKSTSGTGDAGGYVGKMSGNNILTISGSSVNTVTASNGNAGGLVGSAENATINVTGETPFSLSGVTVTAASNKSAGGLVGEYTNTKEKQSLILSNYTYSTITDNLVTLSGGNTGGVFGALTNSGNYTISGGSVTSNLTAGTNYGGLIGKYEAKDVNGDSVRSASLCVGGSTNNITITSTGGDTATTTYGGAIGIVSGSSYVAIENVTASTQKMPGKDTYFGGLVGKMGNGLLNVGNVKIKTTENSDISADEVGGRGGLVGYIDNGVLRLHGTTDLSAQKITTAYHHTGQIVGNNGNGLVYAFGDGSGNYGSATNTDAWKLKRYENANRSGSDIGNWGEVVRLDGTTLKETTEADTTALFAFDQTNHIVKVQGAVDSTTDPSKNTVTLTNTCDFAAYALAFNLNSNLYYNGSDSNAVLSFATIVNPSVDQTVTLSADVNLCGTGILGIGKDDDKHYCNPFTGTFDGEKHTITLDIGGIYGTASDSSVESNSNGSGQIYMRRASNHECHTSLALFPYTSNATVKNITVNGNVKCLIAKDGENNNEKWPVFAAGMVGNAEGSTTFSNVTVNADITVKNEDNNGKSKDLFVMQGGILGQYAGGTTLSFNECIWTSSILTNLRLSDNNRIGGFAGRVLGNSKVEVFNCTLSGSIISSATGNATVGGLIAESRPDQQDNNGNFKDAGNNSVTISNLNVKNEKIKAESVKNNSGGLLGYSWIKTDVTFGGTTINSEGETITAIGVEINYSSLEVGSNAIFGGLVYQATGYWKATAANSIHFISENAITGGTSQNAPSGLLVGTGLNGTNNALYLEVGTWGNAGNAAYKIEENAVALTLGGTQAIAESYFDELVGKTIDNNDNAVVSLAVREGDGITAAKIDTDPSNCNTYANQLNKNFKNGKTRYYYNLDSYRTSGTGGALPETSSLSSPEQVLSWSVSQYAASNIRGYFCSNPTTGATISGTINLTGYSYYPVSPLGTVTIESGDATTTLTFAYDTVETAENDNKKPSDADHQHYLMHHGLLYNTDSNVTVNNTTFAGTVGKESKTPDTFNSGALIFGNISGDTSTSPVTVCTVQLKNVTLAGLKVNGVDRSTTYAPLLINTISKAVTLTVDSLSTDKGYVSTESGATAYAATSLIGNVGSETATNLKLDFSNIALDSRVNAGTDTFVWNNGQSANNKVEYNTYNTIFTNATLLESFQYSSDSSGVYNFKSDDTQVTYGVEISNTTGGRNPGEQYWYYDVDEYSWDGTGTQPTTDDAIGKFYSVENYLRYVGNTENTTGNYHELDINLRSVHLDEGCGTYGHPYKITQGRQLEVLAKYLNGETVNKWVVCVDQTVLTTQSGTATHTSDAGNHAYYMRKENSWYTASKVGDKFEEGTEPDGDDAKMRAYLRNAYYQIQNNIMISDSTYMGIGGSTTSGDSANAFSGVIVGEEQKDGTYPIVYISTQNNTVFNFGGLVRYSQGSVIKNLNVSYAGGIIKEGENASAAKITMSNTAVPSSSNIPFFGGVVGYCMGGDTVIDNVSVRYGDESVTLSGDKERLIAAGGYVGLVGGTKDSDGYEKTGGGVVFRNMEGRTNPFSGAMKNNSDANSTYFYCNPFVGRVLDGYACYDGGTAGTPTLDNTDKNYTIPDVTGNSGLSVSTDSDDSLIATVTSAQGLWLLSAIVNSGAGAMDSTGTYQDVAIDKYVEAYQTGKPRTKSYNLIGKAGGEQDIADEEFWGGKSTGPRYSYLVEKIDNHQAACLTGRSNSAATDTGYRSVNNSVTLVFSKDINMSSYGNGFRGIGGSYGQSNRIWGTGYNDKVNRVYRRTLYVKSVTGNQDGITLILEMNQHDYTEEDNYSDKDNPGFFNQGAGLFTNFSYVNDCQVNKLIISGEVELHTYNSSDGEETYANKESGDKGNDYDFDICVGAFAARTKNASGTLTFDKFHLSNIKVFGGTQTGGAIGCIEQSGGDKTVTFQNWSLINATIETDLKNDGGAGGLIGWHYGGGKLTIDTGSVNITKVITNSQGVNSNNVGGLVNGSNFEVEVKKVQFSGLSASGSNLNAVGGVIGSTQAKITVDDCNFSGLSVQVTGSKSVGGMIGYTNSDTTITETHIQCTADNLAKISNDGTADDRRTGGFIGFLDGADKKTTVGNCSAEYLYVLSKSRTGGLFGQNARKTVNIRNVKLSNTIVVAYGNIKNQRAGLLAGRVGTNDKTIKGYNILADSCKVGYCSAADVTAESLPSAEVTTNEYVGRWVGELNGGSITLVAVAVVGNTLPNKDVGNVNSGTTSITYADYPGNTTEGTGNGSASPYVDVNPKSTLTVKNSAEATTIITLTGNGVGKEVASNILNEAKEGQSNRKYCNLIDGEDETFSKFLDFNNDVYLTTYQTEETKNGTTDVPGTIDFPILVVTGLAKVDEEIWNYIAALTNVESGGKAKEQAATVTANTYKWTGSAGDSFVMVDGTTTKNSLNVNSTDKTMSIAKDAYDNQQSQFTLLDVKYTDPTGGNDNGFHLYVPVLVKKVLYVSFKAKFLAGTNYLKDAYMPFGDNTYATAGFDEPVTAYIEYNYDRTKDDWQAILNNGENLLWNYDKVLDLAKNYNDETKTPLPNGTQLTLVDKQTGQCYIHTFGSTDNVNKFDLSTMTLDGSEDTEKQFKPVPICDLLGLTIDEKLDSTKTPYVSLGKATYGKIPHGATVKVGDTYYRMATNDDEKERCTISVGNVFNETTETSYLTQGEGYYLTIQVPSNRSVSVVNNSLNVYSTTMSTTGAPLASIQKLISSNYVIYDGVKQSEFTISTARNGNITLDTKMEDGDSIQVTLTSTLSLTDSGKENFQNYAPDELDHQFNINMKKYDKDGAASAVLIGATGASYTYTITKSGETTPWKTISKTEPGSETMDILKINCGSDIAKEIVTYLRENQDETLTIQAIITLPYPTLGTYFPGRINDSDPSGISVLSDSRVATATTQLPITTHKESKESQECYYTQNPSNAKLVYNTYDGDGIGDSTRKLGINPSDTTNDLDGLIYTSGVYDYSGVDADILSQAKKIMYTLELFRKDDNGSYNENNPLGRIDEYLPSVTVTGDDKFVDNNKKTAKILTKEFTENPTDFDSININIKPLTGADFEVKEFTYANYKVRLTAVLLDNEENELEGTKASDYIIYTNARIYQQMIP